MQGNQKKQGKQQRNQDRRADQVGREKNRIRKKHPSPARRQRHALAETFARDEEDRQTRQGGEQAVQGQCHQRRGFAVGPKKPEDPRQKQRVNGRYERTRPGLAPKRTAESPPLDDRPGDPSRFAAELPVVAFWVETLSIRKRDHGQAQYQRHQYHAKRTPEADPEPSPQQVESRRADLHRLEPLLVCHSTLRSPAQPLAAPADSP